jgi:SPP1 family predicted phage head-tail adaptor
MNSDKDQVGLLRDLVTIQAPSDSVDAIGGQSVSWSTHASPYAEIKSVSAKERFFGQKLEANVSHKIRIRYLSTVTDSMRVIFGTRTFQIRGVLHEEQDSKWTYLFCEEGVAS